MLASTLLVAAVALFGPPVTNAVPNKPAEIAAREAEIPTGCYKSLLSFKFNNDHMFQSSGNCTIQCVALKKPAIAINGTNCWCSDTLPPAKDKVDTSKCSQKCPGWGQAKCGFGEQYFSTWNTGLKTTVENFEGEDPDSKPKDDADPSKTKGPTVVTNFVGGETVVVTQSSEPEKESSGPNTAGIAAGVVVGIVVLAAAGGGLWFFMRSKARRELEESHRRQAAINSFVKSPSDAPAFDTRLEPAIMRRMSDGSIADNQDYSRRILKVTNA